ncbi:aminotransferase class V-fold PLP-dependent enzyme [Streptomyces sp. NPDC093510]|uniref:aminotransferase class V-fold PLP-dependent enzyme n=1 Tax=Streptomyces sp. NPDC093510 TaxID=3155199 RepID=UPI0034364C69
MRDLEDALAHPDTACLLLVSSRLVRGADVPLAEAVAAAHRRGVPAVVDGAAQDLRIGELPATGADLVLVSGQKYLGPPRPVWCWGVPGWWTRSGRRRRASAGR